MPVDRHRELRKPYGSPSQVIIRHVSPGGNGHSRTRDFWTSYSLLSPGDPSQVALCKGHGNRTARAGQSFLRSQLLTSLIWTAAGHPYWTTHTRGALGHPRACAMGSYMKYEERMVGPPHLCAQFGGHRGKRRTADLAARLVASTPQFFWEEVALGTLGRAEG